MLLCMKTGSSLVYRSQCVVYSVRILGAAATEAAL
jgi:hypothetical protein